MTFSDTFVRTLCFFIWPKVEDADLDAMREYLQIAAAMDATPPDQTE